MARTLFAAGFALVAATAQAQPPFATVSPGAEAWWLRTSFTATGTQVRGIPVAQIRKGWCKASEYTLDLMPKKEMDADGSDKLMKEVGLAFSISGNFDRSKARQVALVGVYQACAGETGAFLLVLDEGSGKVRFVDETPGEKQFAILSANRNDIVFWTCMECDGSTTLRWNAKRKAFGWVK